MADEPAILSERELEVLKLVATGASNQEIARALVISPNTVKVHLRNIFEKLDVQSRTEATMEAVRRRWVAVDSAAPFDNGAAQADMPDIAILSDPLARPAPLARWQRVYMLIAATMITLAAVVPTLAGNGRREVADALFSDAGRGQERAEIHTQLPRWSGGAALPSPRSRLALVAGLRRLYAIGGETSEGVTGQVSVYDMTENRWMPAAEKPTPVSNVSGALIGDSIYVPGGTTSDGGVSRALEVFDAETGAWERRAPMPEPRAVYALSAIDGRLYLFGGWDGATYRRETFAYDPATDTWSRGTPMPKARAFAGAGVLSGAAYIAGGFDGREALSDVIAYDPGAEGSEDGPWSPRAPMSQARSGLAATALGQRLYVLGGGSAEPYGEQYDAGTGAWSRFESPVLGEWRNLAAAAQGQTIYTVGGWAGDYLDVNAAYEAVIRLLLPFGSKGE